MNQEYVHSPVGVARYCRGTITSKGHVGVTPPRNRTAKPGKRRQKSVEGGEPGPTTIGKTTRLIFLESHDASSGTGGGRTGCLGQPDRCSPHGHQRVREGRVDLEAHILARRAHPFRPYRPRTSTSFLNMAIAVCSPHAESAFTCRSNIFGAQRGGWLHRSPRPRRGSHANRSSRILNSLQIFMICRSIAITLVRSGGPSKQCRQDLIVLSLLKPGLLPFQIFLKSSILLSPSNGERTFPPNLRLPSPYVGPILWDEPNRHHRKGYVCPVMNSARVPSSYPRSVPPCVRRRS
jgi:hypothetical protein